MLRTGPKKQYHPHEEDEQMEPYLKAFRKTERAHLIYLLETPLMDEDPNHTLCDACGRDFAVTGDYYPEDEKYLRLCRVCYRHAKDIRDIFGEWVFTEQRPLAPLEKATRQAQKELMEELGTPMPPRKKRDEFRKYVHAFMPDDG